MNISTLDLETNHQPIAPAAIAQPPIPLVAREFLAAASAPLLSSLRKYAYIALPLLVLVSLAAPSISFMLPATQDHTDEIYQPLQALKFFKTAGHAYHKYGPLPNFLLAPGYGVSIAYWKVTGSFTRPSESFPYGFQRPFEQIGFLILQGRLLFFLIGLVGVAYLAHTIAQMINNRLAVALAVLFCIATSYPILSILPTQRPDSPMLGFSALALAVFIRILHHGPTVRRGVCMSLWAVCAVSSKELAAPMFVLPYAALLVQAWRQRRLAPANLRAMLASIAAGVVAYALLNVVYAPATWLQRMDFWLFGPGIAGEVWGAGGVRWRIGRTFAALLDNFGPAGSAVAAIAIVALLIRRPGRWFMFLLPAISVLTLGLLRIHYPAARFYTIFTLALLAPIALGLSCLPADLLRRRPAVAALILLALINFAFATFAIHALRGNFHYLTEQHARSHIRSDETVALLNTHPANAGSTRLHLLGLHEDGRSIGQIAIQPPARRPNWIYATTGTLGFLDDAKKLPARAEMIRKDSGFDVRHWAGVESLGYPEPRRIDPQTPAWFCFDWMPAVQEWKRRRGVIVYHRPAIPTDAPAAVADNR